MNILRDDRGSVLIAGILISAIVLALSASAVALAVHNSEESGENRQRMQSVHAAEAGINYFYSHLEVAVPATAACELSGTVDAGMGSRFTVGATYYDADPASGGNVVQCDPTSGLAGNPEYVLLHSEGTAIGASPVRAIESLVRLEVVEGDPYGQQAIVSSTVPQLGANSQIIGDVGNDADVYTSGDFRLAEMGSSASVAGSVYAQGSVTLDGSNEVLGDVLAGGSIDMERSSRVRGDAVSSLSGITLRNSARVDRTAKAAGTVETLNNSTVGTRIENSSSGLPPERAFPAFSYVANHWSAAGYTVRNFSGSNACTDARQLIEGISTGDWLIRINETCTLALGGTVDVNGDLGIVSDGGMRMDTNSRLTSPSGVAHDVFLVFGLQSSWSCSEDIVFESNSRMDLPLEAFIHTPCNVVMRSNSRVNGQIIAGNLQMSSGYNALNYRPTVVPGTGVQGFDQIPLRTREVPTG